MTTFGRELRSRWLLDPECVYLNHGTVGAPPREVVAARRRLADEVERQPSRFLLREIAEVSLTTEPFVPRLRTAAGLVGRHLGAKAEDLVFVDNTTTGINAILRSFSFRPGDDIVLTDLGYGAVSNIADYVARERGIGVRRAPVPFPPRDGDEVVRAIEAALTPSTRIAVVDHITSDTALRLPIARVAALCRERGVLLLVDGAHAPGSIPLDIESIGATWYVGNLHKWAWTPRSSGVLWCHPDHQAQLHPVVISWGLDRGFTAEFDLLGTRDPTPHLTAPMALDLMASYGMEAVMAYNHSLSIEAAQHLSGLWGPSFEVPDSMVPTMVTVRLPDRFEGGGTESLRMREALLRQGIEVHTATRNNQLFVRLSAQIYNDLEDVDRLGQAVLSL